MRSVEQNMMAFLRRRLRDEEASLIHRCDVYYCTTRPRAPTRPHPPPSRARLGRTAVFPLPPHRAFGAHRLLPLQSFLLGAEVTTSLRSVDPALHPLDLLELERVHLALAFLHLGPHGDHAVLHLQHLVPNLRARLLFLRH